MEVILSRKYDRNPFFSFNFQKHNKAYTVHPNGAKKMNLNKLPISFA